MHRRKTKEGVELMIKVEIDERKLSLRENVKQRDELRARREMKIGKESGLKRVWWNVRN